jgi:hypothetical protein
VTTGLSEAQSAVVKTRPLEKSGLERHGQAMIATRDISYGGKSGSESLGQVIAGVLGAIGNRWLGVPLISVPKVSR